MRLTLPNLITELSLRTTWPAVFARDVHTIAHKPLESRCGDSFQSSEKIVKKK